MRCIYCLEAHGRHHPACRTLRALEQVDTQVRGMRSYPAVNAYLRKLATTDPRPPIRRVGGKP